MIWRTNFKKNNIWSHVTQKRYVVRQSGVDIPDRYFFMEYFANILQPTGSEVMAKKVVLMVFDVKDLDLDISRSFDFVRSPYSPAWLV